MRSQVFLVALALSAFMAFPAYAEQTGSINVTAAANVFDTGLPGKTVDYCSSASDCQDSANYRCLTDYDAVSFNASFTGWCAPASQAGCAHNDSESSGYQITSSGSGFCSNSTAYSTCSSGSWSSATVCTGGQVCSSGACVTPSSSSSGGGSGSSSSSSASAFILISSVPAPFNLTQGDSASLGINVTNGNVTQKNISISLGGISVSWFTVSPGVVASLNPKANATFSVSLLVPKNADVMEYAVSVTASTSNASVSATSSFAMRVLPSAETVEQQIKPSIQEHSTELSQLESRLAQEGPGFGEAKRKKLENLINFAKSALDDAASLVGQGKFFESQEAVAEIRQLVADIKAAFDEPEAPQAGELQADSTLFILIAAVATAAAIGVVLFLFLRPKKKGRARDSGWLVFAETRGFSGRLRARLKKKKKKEESFFDDAEKGRQA